MEEKRKDFMNLFRSEGPEKVNLIYFQLLKDPAISSKKTKSELNYSRRLKNNSKCSHIILKTIPLFISLHKAIITLSYIICSQHWFKLGCISKS